MAPIHLIGLVSLLHKNSARFTFVPVQIIEPMEAVKVILNREGRFLNINHGAHGSSQGYIEQGGPFFEYISWSPWKLSRLLLTIQRLAVF